MGEGKGLRAYIKRTFNVYQWAGGKSLIDTGHGIKGLFRAMTTAKKSARKETFSQAIVRLGLSPSDIDKKERQYK